MDSLIENGYLIFSCRKACDNDEEVDFIVDDEKLVIVAASKANIFNLEDQELELKEKFPHQKIVMTHRHLFNLIETLDQLEKLEAAMIADGDLIDSKPTGRIAEALNWNVKHDTARQVGSC